jgi:hypothetical protein
MPPNLTRIEQRNDLTLPSAWPKMMNCMNSTGHAMHVTPSDAMNLLQIVFFSPLPQLRRWTGCECESGASATAAAALLVGAQQASTSNPQEFKIHAPLSGSLRRRRQLVHKDRVVRLCNREPSARESRSATGDRGRHGRSRHERRSGRGRQPCLVESGDQASDRTT